MIPLIPFSSELGSIQDREYTATEDTNMLETRMDTGYNRYQ